MPHDVSFERPSPAVLRQLFRAIALPLELTSPVFRGLENIPDDRPILFVGNHVVYSGFDAVVLFQHLYREKGIFLRALGDHLHFEVPIWGELLAAFGTVDGTRENCRALMQAGECVLVFPGGAREVAKRRGEAYQLLWGERLGFAKLAIENGCTIVPYATVGGEEMFDIVVDANDLLKSPIGPFVEAFVPRKDALAPLVKGIGFTPIPRPERLYFQFEAPIRVDRFERDPSDENARALRDLTKAAVEKAIVELRELQATDPDRAFTRRAEKLVPGAIDGLTKAAGTLVGGFRAARAIFDVALRGVQETSHVEHADRASSRAPSGAPSGEATAASHAADETARTSASPGE